MHPRGLFPPRLCEELSRRCAGLSPDSSAHVWCLPTLSMSSIRGWEPSSSILCSLRQDR